MRSKRSVDGAGQIGRAFRYNNRRRMEVPGIGGQHLRGCSVCDRETEPR